MSAAQPNTAHRSVRVRRIGALALLLREPGFWILRAGSLGSYPPSPLDATTQAACVITGACAWILLIIEFGYR